MHIFLTGEIQIGKSTLIRHMLAARPELVPAGFRTISVADLPDGAMSVHIVPAADPAPVCDDTTRVGIRGMARGMQGFPAVFDKRGCELLAGAENARLILMDEVGKMESGASAFLSRIRELLDGSVPILGVVRFEGNTPQQQIIRSHPNVLLYTVTRENRDELFELLNRELGYQLDRRVDSAGVILFRKGSDGPEVLMVKANGGWGFPKGHLMAGESQEEAACREVLEETGLAVRVLPGFKTETVSGREGEQRRIYYFLGEITGGRLEPDPEEVSKAAWQPADKVENLLRYREDVPAWREAFAYYSK